MSSILIKNPLLFYISLIVIAIHAIFLAWAVYSPVKTPHHLENRHLVVQTITLQPPTKTISTPKPIEKKAPEKKTVPIPKKEIAKPTPKKTPQPVNKKMEQLLESARSQIDNIQSNKSKITSNQLQVPKWKTHNVQSNSYQEELVSFLKSTLRLPEHGQVDIQLTLDRNGMVKKLKILTSDSRTNQTYVEKMINEIRFPQFSSELVNSKEHTFHFQLSSDI